MANVGVVGDDRRRDRHYSLYKSYNRKVHEADERKKLQERDVTLIGKGSQKHHTKVLEEVNIYFSSSNDTITVVIQVFIVYKYVVTLGIQRS